MSLCAQDIKVVPAGMESFNLAMLMAETGRHRALVVPQMQVIGNTCMFCHAAAQRVVS